MLKLTDDSQSGLTEMHGFLAFLESSARIIHIGEFDGNIICILSFMHLVFTHQF